MLIFSYSACVNIMNVPRNFCITTITGRLYIALVSQDFLREVGCIHRLTSLLEDMEVRLPAVQTLGNVVLSEENIRQAKVL